MLDVTQAGAVTEIVARLAVDGGPVTVLVNNAGIVRDGRIETLTDDDWDRVLSANLTGAFHACRAVIPPMKDLGYGRIVNISSRAWMGNPGQSNYSASKAGLVGMTRALALELVRSGITVNAVAPGLIDTPMIQGVEPGCGSAWPPPSRAAGWDSRTRWRPRWPFSPRRRRAS